MNERRHFPVCGMISDSSSSDSANGGKLSPSGGISFGTIPTVSYCNEAGSVYKSVFNETYKCMRERQ